MKLQTIISLVTIAAAATALVTESSAKRKHRNKGSNRKTGRKTRNTKKGAVGKFRRQHKHQLHQQKRGKHARRGNGRSSNVTVSTTAERKYCDPTTLKFTPPSTGSKAFSPAIANTIWQEANPNSNPAVSCSQNLVIALGEGCKWNQQKPLQSTCTAAKKNDQDGKATGPWQVSPTMFAGGYNNVLWKYVGGRPSACATAADIDNPCCTARLAYALTQVVCKNKGGPTAAPMFCAQQWNGGGNEYYNKYEETAKSFCSGSGPGPSPGPSPAPGPSPPAPGPGGKCGTWVATCPKCKGGSSTCIPCVDDPSKWQCPILPGPGPSPPSPPPSPPAPGPGGKCGTWVAICPTCEAGSSTCMQCVGEPSKWQC